MRTQSRLTKRTKWTMSTNNLPPQRFPKIICEPRGAWRYLPLALEFYACPKGNAHLPRRAALSSLLLLSPSPGTCGCSPLCQVCNRYRYYHWDEYSKQCLTQKDLKYMLNDMEERFNSTGQS